MTSFGKRNPAKLDLGADTRAGRGRIISACPDLALHRCNRPNEIAERWIGTVRRELLDRMLILNRCHLQATLAAYLAHFNNHRPHRSLNQAAPLRPLPPSASPPQYRLRRRDLLGGLIHEYAQVA